MMNGSNAWMTEIPMGVWLGWSYPCSRDWGIGLTLTQRAEPKYYSRGIMLPGCGWSDPVVRAEVWS